MGLLEKPILYSYFRSSCAYRVRLGLHYKGIPFEYRSVHLLKGGGEQFQGEFQQLNPKGEVPVFVHGDKILTQSYVILQYIDQEWSESSPFWPEEKKDRLLCDQLCHVIHSGIQPLHNLSILSYLEKTFHVDEQQKSDWVKHWIRKGLGVWHDLLNQQRSWKGPYTFDQTWTVADMFLIPQIFVAQRYGLSLNQWPLLETIYQQALKREDVQKSLPENQPDTPVV
jgi:maleylacetoacetate isomerase